MSLQPSASVYGSMSADSTSAQGVTTAAAATNSTDLRVTSYINGVRDHSYHRC